MYLILSAALLFLHHLCHEIAHLFCCTFLHLPRDVGVSGCVSPLPAPVLPLSNVAFSIRSFLCHVCASCSVVAQTTTTEQAQSLLIFSEDRNIFQLLLRLLKIPILCLLRRSFCAAGFLLLVLIFYFA